MIKVYQIYILKNFIKWVLSIGGIFYALVLTLNIFEEMNYFKNMDINFLFPFWLNFLNTPSIFYNIFPFIFLIASQFFFLSLIEKNEILILKNIGLNNQNLIKTLTVVTFIFGLFLVLIFYNISAKLKFTYLDLKNGYASDNKYLAVITENGLWIKDEINGHINIINADRIEDTLLKDVVITQFDYNFNITQYIYSDEVDIRDTTWRLKKSRISITGKPRFDKDELLLKTNFNSEKINNLFSNLESLTIWELYKQKKDYEEVGYSTDGINLHLQKIYSLPVYLVIMTILSSVIMLNIKHNKPKIFYILLGILLSVIIFYINHFANILGENNKLPIILSVWLPLLIISILIGIGLVTINEK
jgi:lipopolysaccharide export system permease protein